MTKIKYRIKLRYFGILVNLIFFDVLYDTIIQYLG